jgi:hypothetical protein
VPRQRVYRPVLLLLLHLLHLLCPSERAKLPHV